MKEVRSVAAVITECQSTSVLNANILQVWTKSHSTATSVEYAGMRFKIDFNVINTCTSIFTCLFFVCFIGDYVQRR